MKRNAKHGPENVKAGLQREKDARRLVAKQARDAQKALLLNEIRREKDGLVRKHYFACALSLPLLSCLFVLPFLYLALCIL